MGLMSKIKHAVHVVCLFAFILAFQFNMGFLRFFLMESNNVNPSEDYYYYSALRPLFFYVLGLFNLLNQPQCIVHMVSLALFSAVLGNFQPNESFGIIRTVLLFVLRILSLFCLPQFISNLLGLTLFNAFPGKVQLKTSPLRAPFICFRVVTKGTYPELIRENIKINMEICQRVGLENYSVEVVTDKQIDLPDIPHVREIVVPCKYQTKAGTLFKGRALQYCLEVGVNQLDDDDWIVHLDEESLLSESSVCGILNFCAEGKHEFGQGVITYASGEIVNWITTLTESVAVAYDWGMLRFQFYCLHRPIFSWKGSYMVAKASAERRVSFDHGPDAALAENNYFSMAAWRDGYTFDFIEGEMHEKGAYTLWDFVQQRRRWAKGMFLVAHSKNIPIRLKVWYFLMLYGWALMPFSIPIFCIVAATGPIPTNVVFDSLIACAAAVNLYMNIFGALKQFSIRHQNRPWILIFYALGAVCTIPFKMIAESVAMLLAMFGREKLQFYVVKKGRIT